MTADELAARKTAGMSPLRAERCRRGLTLREVAAVLDVDFAHLRRYESGEIVPHRWRAEQIAAFYGRAVSELFDTDRPRFREVA